MAPWPVRYIRLPASMITIASQARCDRRQKRGRDEQERGHDKQVAESRAVEAEAGVDDLGGAAGAGVRELAHASWGLDVKGSYIEPRQNLAPAASAASAPVTKPYKRRDRGQSRL